MTNMHEMHGDEHEEHKHASKKQHEHIMQNGNEKETHKMTWMQEHEMHRMHETTTDKREMEDVAEMEHKDHGMQEHGHEHKHEMHHLHMLQDFKKRFVVSSILTVPILILSPAIQSFLGFKFEFTGSIYILFLLSSFVYFYGGYPFLKGIFDELKKKNPGMMTLIAVAISVAYFYSSAVVFGLKGKFFFWELATLIDIMLLGHYIEMRSVLGGIESFREEFVKIMSSQANLIRNGEIVEVSVTTLKVGDKVLIKLGEKIPVDGVIVEGNTAVNEAMLTGESKPVTKKVGDKL